VIQLQPPSALVVGPSGSGKTSSIATQLLAGLKVFVIVTEPGGVESLLDSAERLKAPVDNLHWTSALPASAGWGGLEEMISKINSQDQKGIADIKDMGKADFRPAAMKFLNSFRNFTCERTGEIFGDMSTWDDTRVLNVDSLTGWSSIAWGATVGYKPTASPGEWGIGQNFIFNFLMKINSDRRCFFNLMAHMEKEMDEMLGVKKIMVSTIGAKLAPKIPTFFSEVIKAQRTMDSKGSAEFTWSTLASDMDLKNRALPINAKLPADFRQIVDAYKRRKTLAGGSVATSTTAAPLAQPKLVVPQVAPMSPATATK
jgi:hypothetical protein